jgi:hypothetical protein
VLKIVLVVAAVYILVGVFCVYPSATISRNFDLLKKSLSKESYNVISTVHSEENSAMEISEGVGRENCKTLQSTTAGGELEI